MKKDKAQGKIAAEVADHIKKYKIKQHEAAHLWGVTRLTARAWIKGNRPIPAWAYVQILGSRRA